MSFRIMTGYQKRKYQFFYDGNSEEFYKRLFNFSVFFVGYILHPFFLNVQRPQNRFLNISERVYVVCRILQRYSSPSSYFLSGVAIIFRKVTDYLRIMNDDRV